jgi:hypothetical protein
MEIKVGLLEPHFYPLRNILTGTVYTVKPEVPEVLSSTGGAGGPVRDRRCRRCCQVPEVLSGNKGPVRKNEMFTRAPGPGSKNFIFFEIFS